MNATMYQLNASISMCNESTNDTQSSRNKHFIILCPYMQFVSLLSNHAHTASCMFGL